MRNNGSQIFKGFVKGLSFVSAFALKKADKIKKAEERSAKKAEAKKAKAEQKAIRQGEKELMKQLKAEQKEVKFNENLKNYTIAQHVKDELTVAFNKLSVKSLQSRNSQLEKENKKKQNKIEKLEKAINNSEARIFLNTREISIKEDSNIQLTNKWVEFKKQQDLEKEIAEYTVTEGDETFTLGTAVTC